MYTAKKGRLTGLVKRYRLGNTDTVISRIKGGLSVDIGLKAFLPGSQVDLHPIRDLDSPGGSGCPGGIIKCNRLPLIIWSLPLIVDITRFKKFIWMEDMIELVEGAASCDVFSVLKRVDEKSVTEKAFANPKFVEDIVRDVAKKLNADDNITWFSVSAENFESIHNHSAYASITSG